MRGMLYESFLLNRKWFLVAGIAAVLDLLVCAILIANGMMDTANIIFITGEALVVTLSNEWLDRHLENNLKCRFVDVELAAGISKNMFVLSELIKNLITMAFGFAACMAMNGIVFVAEKVIGLEIPFWNIFYVKLAVMLVLFEGLIEFIAFPLVINLKSAEKAGLVIGLVAAFGIILPTMLVYNYLNPEPSKSGVFLEMIYKFLDTPYFYPVVIGVTAVIYAISYVIAMNRVKRGDVC